MKRLTLGLDVDGVLADFQKVYLDYARELWPDFVEKPEWDFGLSKQQIDVLWAWIKNTYGFWETLPVIPGADLLPEADDRHRLIFITSRVPVKGPSVEWQTGWWLEDGLGVTLPTVLVVNHWHEKAALYRDLSLDAFIDDKPETIKQMLGRGLNCYAMAQPWNEGLLPRVKTVNEYIQTVEAQLGSRE